MHPVMASRATIGRSVACAVTPRTYVRRVAAPHPGAPMAVHSERSPGEEINMCFRCDMVEQLSTTGAVDVETPYGHVQFKREDDGNITISLPANTMALLLSHATLGAEVERQMSAAAQAQLN